MEGFPLRYWHAIVLELDVGSESAVGWLSRNVVHQEFDGAEGEVPPAVQAMLETCGACIEVVSGTLVDECFRLDATEITTTKPPALPWARRRYDFQPAGLKALARGSSRALDADLADREHGPETLALAERPPSVAAVAGSSSWQGTMIMDGAVRGHCWRNCVFVSLFWDAEAGPGGETSAVLYQLECFKEIDGSAELERRSLEPVAELWLRERCSFLERASGTLAHGKLELKGTDLETVIVASHSGLVRKHYILSLTPDMASMAGEARADLQVAAASLRLFESPTLVLQLVPREDWTEVSCVMLSGEEKLAVPLHRDDLMADVKRRILVQGVPQSKVALLLPNGELVGAEHLTRSVADVFEAPAPA